MNKLRVRLLTTENREMKFDVTPAVARVLVEELTRELEKGIEQAVEGYCRPVHKVRTRGRAVR